MLTPNISHNMAILFFSLYLVIKILVIDLTFNISTGYKVAPNVFLLRSRIQFFHHLCTMKAKVFHSKHADIFLDFWTHPFSNCRNRLTCMIFDWRGAFRNGSLTAFVRGDRGQPSSINLRDVVSVQCISHTEEVEGCPVIDYWPGGSGPHCTMWS